MSQLLIHNIKYRKLRKLCARIYETSRCLLQDMTISIVKCLLKNIYICTVYTIFADYLFPCKWLSVSITGFRTDYFVYPRSFFLVHLTRKTQKKRHCTWHCWTASCHNLTSDCFSIHSKCYLFLHSRENIHMKCLLVYSDLRKSFYRMWDKERKQKLKT